MTQLPVFSIRDYKIDLSRSVIEQGERQTKMEPKVLKVLYVLAQHQNEVVTHQTLMEQVWQGAEVVPNALQRCIAILRKELGDDAKSPNIIATHPKIGYRLLSEVTWHHAPKTRAKIHLEFGAMPWAIAITCIALLLVFSVRFWPKTPAVTYTQLTELTNTDAHESHAIYSPNGQYIVFNRYAGSCKSHIWAKALHNGKETQLSAEAGQFGAPSFTPDGRELVFVTHNTCDKAPSSQSLQTSCWTLSTLDFAQALSGPQAPNTRYQCQTHELKTPKALANHQYAFLQLATDHTTLMLYNDLDKSSHPLFNSDALSVYHFDYHPKRQQFAVFAHDQYANTQLMLLDKHGKVQQQVTLQPPEKATFISPLIGNFSASGEYLLAVSDSKLYKVELDGQISELTTPSKRLLSVTEHPNQTGLLAVQGNKDIDIAQIDLHREAMPQQVLDLHTVTTPYLSTARSSAQERLARFAPNAQNIAFISNRTGQDEIWLWHPNNDSAQLTNNVNGETIHGYAWSADSRYVAWASNGKLAITDLTGNSKLVSTHQPLFSVLHWLDNNTLLVVIKNAPTNSLYQFDIKENKLIAYHLNDVQSAWVSQNRLIYTTKNNQVFSRAVAPNEQPATPLPHLNGKALLVKNGAIYSVDKDTFALKQYDLNGEVVQTLKTLKPTAWKITDLKDTQLLLEQFIAIDQEVVVLHH
ncbi:winged helix-turn-helix domain-containing protein [Pseudoalteromonas sp. MMG022]|uniref:winged helix-turn-helix domain-containing protein n=1 Tax=Pseudoalteromonas sp. MMG022 TaxID=2909978 RepID=UPI001F01E0A2|nr:winged helix-turn-helix domain-containing protein [Pseudoalteromonas sp. MMG022]MCF6437195.1 winged helix-turn-helix domain-containing protein [Pseudoalteromonas sp. MMG022]